MDFKNSLEYRTGRFKAYEFTGEKHYDYEKEGILEKCLPKLLFKGNSVLVTFLQLLDMRLIMLTKYITKIKQFKFFSWYV